MQFKISTSIKGSMIHNTMHESNIYSFHLKLLK